MLSTEFGKNAEIADSRYIYCIKRILLLNRRKHNLCFFIF